MKNVNDIPVVYDEISNQKTPINMNTQAIKPLSEMTEAELTAELQRRKDAKQADRSAYKEAVEETVPKLLLSLAGASSTLTNVKTDLFNTINALLSLKNDVYGIRDGQQSHTFSDSTGNTVSVGYRVTDGWDDTVNSGIAKINEFMTFLATDTKSATLVKTINNLLKKDAKGNLKANRVIELQQMAEEFQSPLFNDGIDIIVKGYKPVKSCYFVEASYTDETGKKQNVPLSISAADFAEGTNLDLSFFKTLKSK